MHVCTCACVYYCGMSPCDGNLCIIPPNRTGHQMSLSCQWTTQPRKLCRWEGEGMNRCYGKGWGGVGIMWKCGLWGWGMCGKSAFIQSLESSDVMHVHVLCLGV